MSIDETESLAEEDLSDEALEGDATCEDCGAPGEACPGCGKVVCQSCGEAEGAFCRCFPAVETITAGDFVDSETGEVLKDAPGWDKMTRTILNRDGLEWAGRRLRDVEESLAENHRAAAAELKELEERLRKAQERHAKADAPLLASRAFLDAAIRVYAAGHRAELLKGRRGKTARLPSGLVLAWKSGGGEYRLDQQMKEVDAKLLLVEWALEEEEGADGVTGLVDYTPRPVLDAIKKHLKSQMTETHRPPAPPGLEYVPEHEELVVKVEE